MRRAILAAGVVTAALLSAAMSATQSTAQTGQERLVVFETFGREN